MMTKMKHVTAILTATLILCVFTGCVSTAPQAPREPDEHYLGDFNPFQLDNAMCVTKSVTGSLNPCEMEMYFAPRKNTVEAHFSYAIDKVALVFNLEEREAFYEGIMAYMDAYNTGNMPVREPDKKNYLTRSPVTVSWGVFGLAYTADTFVRINYDYLEADKPYMLATFENATAKDDDASSPLMNLYFTPSQLESLCEIINQDEFQSRVDELNRQAFEW